MRQLNGNGSNGFAPEDILSHYINIRKFSYSWVNLSIQIISVEWRFFPKTSEHREYFGDESPWIPSL